MPKVRKRRQQAKPVQVHPPGSIAAFAQEHGEWLTVRNFSNHTVINRQIALARFAQWCSERGIIEPSEVTKPIVERYQKWLFQYRRNSGSGAPLSFSSQHAQLVSIRVFFRWLAKNNYVLHNPASDIELPRLDRRLPRTVLSVKETEAVLNAVDLHEPMGIRNRAILETFYSTGMRRAELANLLVYDLSFEQGTVLIRLGKGRKDRVIPIGERALLWIRKYMDEIRPSLAPTPDNGILFLSEFGEPLCTGWVTLLVSKFIAAAGIGKKGGCHLFRHTCATLMHENGADIRFIQQQLGHANIAATEVYTRVAITKLKEIHTATHPGARLNSPHVDVEE